MDKFSMTPAQFVQGYCVLAITAILGVNAIPPIRDRFLHYGPRQLQQDGKKHSSEQSEDRISSFLDSAAALEVPHSWFIQFYILSVSLSLFWGYQIFATGYFFRLVASIYLASADFTRPSMSMNQVALVWLAMLLQGGRRLYECIAITKSSKNAKMGVLAYTFGISYYVAVSVGIWVEGLPTILAAGRIEFSKPSTKTLISLPLFMVASGVQHDCHLYLASLKKYTLPQYAYFRWILCPHYTAECVIYLSFAILAAPQGQLLNNTVTTLLFLVVANLGVTAESSRMWYAKKFGENSIKGRWRLVPFIY